MIYIAKGKEPDCMRQLRRKGLRYKDLEKPQYLKEHYQTSTRQALLVEQHYLCGYCCGEIDVNS